MATVAIEFETVSGTHYILIRHIDFFRNLRGLMNIELKDNRHVIITAPTAVREGIIASISAKKNTPAIQALAKRIEFREPTDEDIAKYHRRLPTIEQASQFMIELTDKLFHNYHASKCGLVSERGGETHIQVQTRHDFDFFQLKQLLTSVQCNRKVKDLSEFSTPYIPVRLSCPGGGRGLRAQL